MPDQQANRCGVAETFRYITLWSWVSLFFFQWQLCSDNMHRLTKFLKVCEAMGLWRTHQQNHDVETICNAMTNLCPMYPNAGVREVVSLLFHEWNMSVPRWSFILFTYPCCILIDDCYHRSVVISYFHTYELELVRQHKANRLRRKQFWAAGVNNLFAVNQHDKWLRYGLGLHTGIEPFSGCIMWMRVWHSNRCDN